MSELGLWVWRVDRCGGVAGIRGALELTGADRLIVKSRDGLTAYNAPDLPELARLCEELGVELHLWAWPYPRQGRGRNPDVAGDGYVVQQAHALAMDARRYKTAGVYVNAEAPWSWSGAHRWAPGHLLAWGRKANRQAELRHRASLYMLELANALHGRGIALSTFPLPRSHALPFGELLERCTTVAPQFYFGGLRGYRTKAEQIAEQWSELAPGVPLRCTIAGWRGVVVVRRIAEALDTAVTSAGVAGARDVWVLDKMKLDDAHLVEALQARWRPARAA